MDFLENLYRQAVEQGFYPIGQDEVRLAEAAGFTLAKVENSALLLLHVMDTQRMDGHLRLFLRDRELERATALIPMYSSVWIVFLSVGEEEADISAAEAYYGQSPYAIYWHVNPSIGEIKVPDNQPDDVMGLKNVVQDALNGIEGTSPLVGCGSGPHGPGSDFGIAPSINEQKPPTPIFTITLATVNIAILLLMYIQGYRAMPMAVAARFGAIVPHLIWGAGEYYRLLTAMFVHFGWAHMFFNVAGIMIFGTRVERHYGRGSFLAIYFISGLAASVASLFLTRGFSAGASGAVYGLLGAAFVYTRYTKRTMDVINNHVLLIYIVMGLGMGFIVPGIDYYGHIGGLAAGLLVGFVALKVNGFARV